MVLAERKLGLHVRWFRSFSIDDADPKAARVLVYESGDVELASSGILTQCINAGRDQYGNTIPGATYYDDKSPCWMWVVKAASAMFKRVPVVVQRHPSRKSPMWT